MQDTAGTVEPACSLFIILIILWVVFNFTLSVTHRTDAVISENHIFFSPIFSPKNSLGMDASQSFLPGNTSCLPRPWNLSGSVLTGWESIKVMGTDKKAAWGDINCVPDSGKKNEKRATYQTFPFIERPGRAGPFCRTREQLGKYKLAQWMQFMAD